MEGTYVFEFRPTEEAVRFEAVMAGEQVLLNIQQRQMGVEPSYGTVEGNLRRVENAGGLKQGVGFLPLVLTLKDATSPDAQLTARIVKLLLASDVFCPQPDAYHEQRYISLLKKFFLSPLVVSELLEPLFLKWISLFASTRPPKGQDVEKFWTETVSDGRFQAMVGGIGLHGTVPMIGTVWRLAQPRFQFFECTDVNQLLIAGRQVPLPVFARFSPVVWETPYPKLEFRSFNQTWHRSEAIFWEQVEKEMPDLADLPQEMLLDVLATQPIPEDWFTDVVSVGDVTWVAPGVEVGLGC